jgi:hypothetical protein
MQSRQLSNHPIIVVPQTPQKRSSLRNPRPQLDELALTSFSYPVEEPETSADELLFTSFSYPFEDDISADALDHTSYPNLTASKKRLGTD